MKTWSERLLVKFIPFYFFDALYTFLDVLFCKSSKLDTHR